MKVKRYNYKVEFLIKKNGDSHYFVNVWAKNQKEAKEIAKSYWYEFHYSHMFHISAKRSELSIYVPGRFYYVREY